MEKKFYVYLHIRKTDGIPFYIGKGHGYRKNSKHNRNKFWNKVYNKHGFEPIILDENLDEKTSFELEMYWISQFKSWGFKLTNCTDGGEGTSGNKNTRKGIKLSQEHKDKISAANKGKRPMFPNSFKKGNIPWNKGKTYKMPNGSIARTGLKQKGKKTIIDGIEFDSIRRAAEYLNITECALTSRLRKNETHILRRKHFNVEYKIIDLETGIKFKTLNEASEYVGLKRTTLGEMLRGKNKNKTTLKYIS